MERIVRIMAMGAAVVVAGCASAPLTHVAEEKQYRTGSNIAERDHRLRGSVQTKEINTADPDQFGLPNGGRLPRSFGGGS
jgi:hypothetical protein